MVAMMILVIGVTGLGLYFAERNLVATVANDAREFRTNLTRCMASRKCGICGSASFANAGPKAPESTPRWRITHWI